MTQCLKEGDLVTVDHANSQMSNTYVVVSVLDDRVFLRHPLAPECLIERNSKDLDNDLAVLKPSLEKCLEYAKKNSNMLGYTAKADLEALCFYYVVKKTITPKQRNELSHICGKLAAIELEHNTTLAVEIVKKNAVLLDEFMQVIFNHNKKALDNPAKVDSRTERFAIFNLAGFILANLR